MLQAGAAAGGRGGLADIQEDDGDDDGALTTRPCNWPSVANLKLHGCVHAVQPARVQRLSWADSTLTHTAALSLAGSM